MDFIFTLLVLVPIGFFFGRFSEKRHERELEEKEKKHSDFVVSDIKSFPGISSMSKVPKMFVGEVTIAGDYYKTFAGGLRNLFGGEMKLYSSLVSRARREAIFRLVEQAKAEGYNAACNLRVDSADINGSVITKKKSVSVSIIASATAYCIDA